MTTSHLEVRQAVLDAARRSVTLGLTHGTSGNVSARVPGGGFAITPSGLDYAEIEAPDIVLMGEGGVVFSGERWRPSTEWRMHAALYRQRPDLGAVVHGHSPAATAVACLGRDLPPFHYMIAAAGGDSVRCAPYAPFGTESLAGLAVDAMRGRRACLLAHHGFLAAGVDPAQALAVAGEVEFLAGVFLRILPFGDPPVLSPDAMAEVLAKFKEYGQRRG